MQCYGIDILSPANGLNLITTAMLYLAGSTLVLIVVSIYLSYVLPGEYGVRKSPFFPLIGGWIDLGTDGPRTNECVFKTSLSLNKNKTSKIMS